MLLWDSIKEFIIYIVFIVFVLIKKKNICNYCYFFSGLVGVEFVLI